MSKKSLLMMLLLALLVPWAASAQESIPYTEGFENMSTASDLTDAGWISYQSHSGSFLAIEASSSYVHTGTKALLIDSWDAGSNSDYVILGLPTVDAAINTLQITFSYKISSSYGGNMEVGYLTNVGDASTFVSLQTCANSTSYATETVELNGAPNDAARIAIKYIGYYRCYVDDIEVKTIPTCPKPTDLIATLIDGDGTKAKLNWTENGSATQWQVCLDGDMTNLIPANTNVDFELTGLTAEVDHTAKVRAYCNANDQSDWSNEVTFRPTNAFHLTVNDGTANNSIVPVYGLWVDDITQSQFIIPADDLADAANGTITQLTFYAAADKNWGAARFEVYMAEVAETTVSAMADWSTMYKVMNAASLGITNGVMVVNLDTPFDYTGGNLLIGFQQTVSGTYQGCSWYGVTATGASMGGYGTSNNQQNFLPKTTIAYLPGEAPTCPKPRGLVAGTPAARSVVLNWTETGEARAWQICLNGDETNLIPANTNEDFLLEGLTPDTDYTIKVRSYCSEDDQSDWSNEVTIHTDVTCPAPTDLTVSDITPFAANVAWSGTASSYNFAVQEPVFFYGFEDAEPWDTLNFPPCTTYDGDGAKCYGSGDFDFPNENYHGACIAMQNGVYGDYNDQISAHSGNAFGGMWDAIPSEIQVGTTTNDWFILPEIAIENGMVFSFWAREIFTNWGPEIINVGAYGTTDGTFASLLAENVEIGNTTWMQYSYDLSAYAGQTIKLAINCVSDDVLAFFFDDLFVGYNYVIDENDIIPNATSPQALVLEPETTYQVLVQSACGGEDGESAWVYDVFTTPSNCVAPFDLNVTDLKAQSATLNWTGYQDGFQVRYRTVEHTGAAEGSFFEDFENNTSLTGWTVIRNGEGTQYTDWHVVNSETLFSSGAIPAHSGSYVVMGRSWNSDAYNVDNWLITPQVTLDGTLSYWVYDDGEYHENCDVYVSTTTADIDAFTLLADPESATNEWTERTVDLSSFNGQLGYIAFRLQDEDKDFLFIDDVLIGSIETVPAGEWQYGTTDALFFNTNDNPDYPLIPDTDYEWQVRGENRSCGDEGYTEWSEMAYFHTESACGLPTNLETTDIEANAATLTWDGVQEDYNVRYRTAGFDGYYLKEDWDGEIGDWTGYNWGDNTSLYYEDDTYTNLIFMMVALDGTDTDQYLFSPDMREEAAGNTLTFNYAAYSGDYTESFEVGFVATDSIYSEAVQTNDTVWQTYTTVVPEGALYMYIYYEDGYALMLDNFVCYTNNPDEIVAAGEWIETLEGVNSPVAIEGLDPETYYEWEVQGNSELCGDGATDWVTAPEFKTLESEGQTIALVAGTNWFSTYLDIELGDLQAALNAALPDVNSGITIKAKVGNSTLRNGNWRSTNNFVWDVAKMYRIEVPADCEITLTGDPINPADNPITILAGEATWIGFPFSESMDPADVIPAGFAINGDVIKGKEGNFRYTNRWRPTGINALEPGKGYMYVPSSNAGERTLVYTTGSKKASQTIEFGPKKNATSMSLTPKMMQKAFNQSKAAENAVAKKAKKNNEDCKSINK